MIHMGFSGVVAFFLVRVFKVVAPVKMTFQIYATCVIPISAFFASSLWFGNTAYLHISVAFIQMLKALMPVATFLMAVICGTDKLRCDVFLNMVLVSVGLDSSVDGVFGGELQQLLVKEWKLEKKSDFYSDSSTNTRNIGSDAGVAASDSFVVNEEAPLLQSKISSLKST
ncbi:hypothetical protein BHE74_00040794 [Ensete ventricosum]|nr:hypothetical protein GW17_00041614 [Ensete ventricosum]RWW52766.1 hypothetical protein BHE74_00040794 [Ensete ventricosum]